MSGRADDAFTHSVRGVADFKRFTGTGLQMTDDGYGFIHCAKCGNFTRNKFVLPFSDRSVGSDKCVFFFNSLFLRFVASVYSHRFLTFS